MNIKKLFLVFVTALIAQFSFALVSPASVALANQQVQQSNRVVDFHSMLDAGTYGIYSDAILLNGPPATGIKTAIVVYAYKDNYDKVVNQTVFDSEGSGWQEYYDYGTQKWSAWSQFGGGGGQKGDKGDKGDTGPQGLPGVKGDTGLIGQQGIQGVKGDIGAQGANGDQGIQGVAGKDGAQGIKGETGAKGDTGAQGVKGDKGDPSNITTLSFPTYLLSGSNITKKDDIDIRNAAGQNQSYENGLVATSNALTTVHKFSALSVASGKTIKLTGRLGIYNLDTIDQSNYYIRAQFLGITTGGQYVNLGDSVNVDLSKVKYTINLTEFSASQALVTNLISVGVKVEIIYASTNTAIINDLLVHASIE